jgi:hypothetical protein
VIDSTGITTPSLQRRNAGFYLIEKEQKEGAGFFIIVRHSSVYA